MLNFILSIFSIVPNRAAMPLLVALAFVTTLATPSFASDAFTVGCGHYKAGKYALAKAFFAKAAHDDPTSLAAHYQLANTFFQLGDYSHASAEYNACLCLQPDARMRSFCVAAINQIHHMKKAQASKIASSSTSSSSNVK